jgi:hypothetical protein
VRQAAAEFDRLTMDADERESLHHQIDDLQSRMTALENELRRLGGKPQTP